MRLIVFLVLLSVWASAQTSSISGSVVSGIEPVAYATIYIKDLQKGTITNEKGEYHISGLKDGSYSLLVSSVGYVPKNIDITILGESTINITLMPDESSLDEVVVTGTMKEVSKLESPVPVEVYTKNFFRANPTPSIFESLQNINGVRPQINCNICNTGDIHINGLEGPYTMVLIDGMPIVSGLSTVYGLTGIPQSLIERVEIVKGPASTLYGSEAVGGLVNIITKKLNKAPLVSADVFTTSWGEVNADLGFSAKINHVQSLTGINYFNYQNPIDNNGDGFTDVTLQDRISIFNKVSFERPASRVFTLAARYLYEDRWGGDMNWNPSFRGGDLVYGESIYTSRWEAFGTYQIPSSENLMLQFSANGHRQNSVYGEMPYMAIQNIYFAQLTWNKKLGQKHDLLLGTAYRHTFYDDNTAATATFEDPSLTQPAVIDLPGVFLQDEIHFNASNTLLMGVRFDYNSVHGSTVSPRLNYKWSSKNKLNTFRFSAGNGYRVANVFTEDHAALTGAREVVFANKLLPETSWNGNLNFVKKIFKENGTFIGFDATAFYTYFSNKIIPDYETDPNKIIYANLNGFSVSQGLSLNADLELPTGLKFLTGATVMDVSFTNNGLRQRQLLTERWSGVWSAAYTFRKRGVSIDYTGNILGSMNLPLLGDLDDRPGESPIFSIQNIQLTKVFRNGFQLYGGVKNFLNYTPPANSIARAFDPFDKGVIFDPNGGVVPTVDNPNGLTFDPSYMFAPNQGIRGFVGLRYTLN